MSNSVLFLLPYPLHRAPSQRFRVESYFPLLGDHNINYRTSTFLDDDAWKELYLKGSILRKAWAVAKGFFKRFYIVFFVAPKYHLIFIHREAAPLGPPIFEWILVKILRKKIIFDFDDAIWIPNVTESNRLAGYAKCFWKIGHICKWSNKVSAGNAFLEKWARQYNKHVLINPTCVDVVNRYNRYKQVNNHKVVIGWTGSHSTLIYLDLVYPVLKMLETEYNFEFLVICNQPPSFSLRSLSFVRWNEKAEIDDLLKIDIGLMPLVEDPWSEGKCGFKIIQYLALGIPAIASPVGVNRDIVEEGKNGFLCQTEDEWYKALKYLLEDRCLRMEMGKAGREKIMRAFSVQANKKNFLSLFEKRTAK